MIEWFVDRVFDFDYKSNNRGAILAGGWIFVLACLLVLFDTTFDIMFARVFDFFS